MLPFLGARGKRIELRDNKEKENISHTIAVFVLTQESKCVRHLFSIAVYFNWQL